MKMELSKYKKFNYIWFKNVIKLINFCKSYQLENPYKFDYFLTNIIFKFLNIFNQKFEKVLI